MENPENPKLSIIIASDNSSHTIEDCLDALKMQTCSEVIEIIVVDCSTDGTIRVIKDKFPYVKLIHFPRRIPLPFLLGKGISCSSGEIIAITDATCFVDPHWVSEILKAHEGPHSVIGGAVEIEEARRSVDWAAYFCEYGQFMRPFRQGVVKEMPGNNLSFKRWTLEIGQEYVQGSFWKTYWCFKLQEEGVPLILSPSIVLYCKKSYYLVPFLIRRFHHGRCFAGMRIVDASIFTRIYYIVGSLFLPFLLLMRTIKAILPKKRYLKEFIISFPVSVMAIVSWSFGEFWGYIAGPEQSFP